MITLGYGVLIALALIVFSLVVYLVNIELPVLVLIVTLVILLVGIVLAQLNYRSKYLGGYIEYGKAFTIGFLTTLFLAVIVTVYTFIFYKYINPGAFEEQLAKAEQDMIAQGRSESEVELGMKWYSMFANPGMSALMALIMNLILGTIFSLITSIFVKQEGQGFDQPQV